MTEESQERRALREATIQLRKSYDIHAIFLTVEESTIGKAMLETILKTTQEAITAAEKALGEKHDG